MISDDLAVKFAVKLTLAAGAVLLVGGAAWFIGRQVKKGAGVAGELAGKVVDAVNPASDKNLAYQGANKVTQAVTGQEGDTLGVALWRMFNPAQSARDEAIEAPTLNALDHEDAALGYEMDLNRAQSPYLGNWGQAVRGSFARSALQ